MKGQRKKKRIRKKSLHAALLLALAFACGCAGKNRASEMGEAETVDSMRREETENGDSMSREETESEEKDTSREEAGPEEKDTSREEAEAVSGKKTVRPEVLHFVDVYGQKYKVDIDPKVKKHDYKLDAFLRDGQRMSYIGDERYTYRLGIDVSYHQGYIDWQKVKADGYDFAILRIGYRGYGQEGRLCRDTRFKEYIQNAQNAGLDVGVYFFSQAVNEAEAEEEARLVLDSLQGCRLQLPVVYDPESILDDAARTDNVTGEQFTKNTKVFCQMVEDAGYQPMIYSNMLWEAFQFDLKKLAEYPIWYADYEPLPQTPYHFSFWQYDNEGVVDGIEGNVDLDIQLIQVPAKEK